jgi:hypothetical protein
LALSELLLIQQHLSAKGLAYIVPRILNPSSPVLILEVPRDRVGDTASKEKTSRRQLTFVSKSLEKKFGKRVIVTLRDAQALDDIAVSLRAVLKHEFPAVVSDVYASFVTSTAAVVWVESKTIIGPKVIEQLRSAATRELAEFGVMCRAFDIVLPQQPEPSTTAILRAVKVHAPASLAAVNQDLLRRGFFCPSEKWLSYKLDIARKRGLVLRDQDGRFLLTAGGLEVVPWSRTASSSDVDRMLSLARRKEW